MMSDERKANDCYLEDESLWLSILVQLENGATIRLQEQKKRTLIIAVSQGFSHKKTFKKVSSYGNLKFYPYVELDNPNEILKLIAGLLVSFEGVVECLISGPSPKRRKLRDLLGDDTNQTGRTIVWGVSKVSPIDLSTLITMTPKRGILTLFEALYPLEDIRKKLIKNQINQLSRETQG